jgi:glycosyltransferase involved in cell wall biosynthesis
VHALGCQSRRPWQRVLDLANLFRRLEIDIVHTHNATPHAYGTAAGRWAGVPVVLQTRHGQRFGHGLWANLRFRLASRWADRVVAVSDDAARLCCSADGLQPAKVTRIWNGIDATRFQFRGAALNVPRPPVAISVARLSAEKDFPTLLRAAALVVRDVPDFRLQIVGGGAERPALEQLARELNVTDQVQFLGERSDIPELLAAASFFVSSSLTEGVSLTLLEAMAVGLPVVATAVGGNPEVVVEGVTGRLVPAAAPEALAAAMTQMCRNPETWGDLGRNGRERVEEHFSIRRMLSDYEALYRELLNRRLKTIE